MPAISPVSPGTTGTSGTDPAAPSMATGVGKKMLGQDEFLRLLAVQFQMQDPMKPMDDTAFIAQTAQFTALQQSTAMVGQLAELQSGQHLSVANSYLGLHVSVDGGNGAIVSGVVSSITMVGGEPRLVLGDQNFPLSAVLTAERVTGSAPAPAPEVSGPA